MLFNIISWVCIILVISSVLSIVCIYISYKADEKKGRLTKYNPQDLFTCAIVLPIFWIVLIIMLILKKK